MNVVLDGHTGRFDWGLKEGANVNVKTDIGKGGGNHLCASIMSVLAHFRDQYAGTASFDLSELIGHLAGFLEFRVGLAFRRVDARNGPIHCLVPPEYFLECA